MEKNKIKQVLNNHLKSPENENFNTEIIHKLNVKQQKKPVSLFNEKTIVYWFLIISCFVLFFFLKQTPEIDNNAISITCILCAVPIYLMIYNKIYSLKNNI